MGHFAHLNIKCACPLHMEGEEIFTAHEGSMMALGD